jgi:hypothetical protein
MTQLTEQQIRFFDTFGYLKFEGLFADDIDKIQSAFTQVIHGAQSELLNWCHQAHSGMKRQVLPQFIDRDAYLSSLIDDARINGIFSSLLGNDFIYRGSDANLFDCNTCWHSDTYGALLKYRNVKIIFYLDPLRADSGCLRVIPGSHLFGDYFANRLQAFLKKNDSYQESLGLDDCEIPAHIIPSNPGDLIVFDFRLKHATCFASDRHRQMFTVCAAEKMQEEDIPRLREEIAKGKNFGIKQYYGDAMMNTATPGRLVHMQQCIDNQDVLL